MNHQRNSSGKPQAALTLLVIGGMLVLAIMASSSRAQEKPKAEAKDQKKTEAETPHRR